MWIENSKLRSPGLTAVLDAGEQVITGVNCAAAPIGLERVTEPPPTQGPGSLTGPQKVGAAAVVAVGSIVSPPAWGGNAMMRLLGGIRVAGTTGSIGVRLLRALDGNARAFVVVTDRRLLFTDSALVRQPDAERSVDTWSVRLEIPRSAVIAARRRARSFVVGRVELQFIDGSMAAVMTGLLSARPARRLLRALDLPPSRG